MKQEFKIVVIGSSGFIGSEVCKHFLSENSIVIGVDFFNNRIGLNKNFDFIDAPVFFNSIENYLQDDVNWVINCAGSASVAYSFENPFEDFDKNSILVYKILNAIKNKNTDIRFLNISSAAIYGNPTVLPIKEDSSFKPISPYGIHKHLSEIICREFNEFHNVKTVSLRVFSAFGPGLRKQLFWDLYQKAVSGNTVVYGTGKESRDFIYITDLVNALYLICCNNVVNEINVANGEQIYISNVVQSFQNIYNKLFNKEINFSFNNVVKTGDPINWEADVTLLNNLGYQPLVSVDEGIEKYLMWLKSNAI